MSSNALSSWFDIVCRRGSRELLLSRAFSHAICMRVCLVEMSSKIRSYGEFSGENVDDLHAMTVRSHQNIPSRDVLVIGKRLSALNLFRVAMYGYAWPRGTMCRRGICWTSCFSRHWLQRRVK
jgi:hypothetical protein